MTQKIEYMVGCDPELFVIDSVGDFISAHNLLPGNKIVPHQVDGGAIQVDGTAAEFNILPATGSLEFSRRIEKVLGQMSLLVRSENPEFKLSAFPVANFKPEYFKNLPAEALMFGCSPDFQAWEDGKEQEFLGTTEPLRTGGGHIHVGWTKDENSYDQAHFFDCIQATKQLDSSLFLASLLWDNNDTRRRVYGKMGSFRPKPYGVEYRPLSNLWVGDRSLHVFVFRCVEWAMKLLDYDGVELWDTDTVADYIPRLRAGYKVSRNDLIELHKEMQTKFGMPKLPAKYLVKEPVDPLANVSPEQAAKAILGA